MPERGPRISGMEETPDPSSWPPEDFPDPNPYFPPPRRWSGYLPLFLVMSVFVGCVYFIYHSFADPFHWPLMLHYWAVPAAGGIGVVTLFRLKRATRRLAWVNAVIIPAEVVWPPCPPDEPEMPRLSIGTVVSAALPGMLGLAASVLTAAHETAEDPTGGGPPAVGGTSTAMAAQYVHHGELFEISVSAFNRADWFRKGDIFWLCWQPGGRSYPVAVCGGWWSCRAIPDANVVSWLQRAKLNTPRSPAEYKALRKRFRMESESESELRQAAKANTQAMKRAERM